MLTVGMGGVGCALLGVPVQHEQLVPSFCPPQQLRKGPDQTLLEVWTPQVEQLPLLDVRVMDFGGPDQKFGFTVGPACFLG